MVGRAGWFRGVWSAAFMAVVACSPFAVAAQEPLTADDYGQWERLGSFSLSPDGRWLVTAISRVDGDSELRLRRSDGSSDPIVLLHGRSPEFSADGRWMAYRKGVSA